jgi:hypothetical protein
LQAFNSTTSTPNSLVINPFGGNVGVGTASPDRVLQIVYGGNIGGAGASLGFGANANQGSMASITASLVGNGAGNDYGDLKFQTRLNGSSSLSTALLISHDGLVGIGTTSPDSKLTVNGTLHSMEVKVDMSILPDYVFESGYRLLPLMDVKTFVDKNHHLPEVPSAKEVAQNGLKLGEMNALLLKKVEELTLYLIEKDKQLTNQQKVIERQDERISVLEKVLAKQK